MGMRREVEESYGYGLWNEIFLDCGNVETMNFFYILSLFSKWAHLVIIF